ncbi:hypothetical protein [Ascidiimonas sp. W6]|uniref:hypothetical protein n=1 Tax=Ascidiimonas meishanensis TaxID=3128903 RepID=UPI0030EB2AE5
MPTTTADAFNEALERIDTWITQNPPSTPTPIALNFSGIGLTDQDLKDLMPVLEQYSQKK